ncbi:ATP-dependent DNA ligase [Cnuibacter physcomitrellae]|uniref:ATP-dependent DNA ligase n=1 Tax=Cnuibacter physcomitrellae TaxID=1619308 RepID=UPI002175CBD0|nr:ATP-dependent DNA ligase [Cnuibacter physcomitrellae]MCS5495885.1 ATP-dependent DNA ligase [Cnuibacter physcomitrellae]
MAPKKDEQVVTVGGHRLKITNLDKVLYPETGTTKGDVLRYYSQIAPFLIPHARNRPATRKRWVNGVGTPEDPGTVFFQKDLDAGTPDWVKRVEIEHSEGPKTYPLVNDEATLVWLAQIAALEVHVPQWRVDAHGRRKNPDRFVIDLDPGEGAGLPECVEVAKRARRILTDMGLDPVPVTSGSKGIHLYAALDGTQTSDQVSAVAHELARALEADDPDLVVSDMKKSLRTGRVLVDWSQNNANKTTICPYSLRGRFRPTVAVPRTWRELASKDLRHLELDEVLTRMRRRADPLAESADAPGSVEAPGGVWHSDRGADDQPEAHPGEPDRLTVYRSKRDAAKTPEPVPEASPADTGGRSFVIQEHHASRLHWDFRLEHDGVLVSWALPKGVPTDAGQNHLAVMTEDHPLEYGTFEGTIPEGEYGGGTVTIWDFGTYELEKWRDDEVIATLHGQPSGGLGEPRRVALIRTGGRGGKDPKNWLIHLMKDQHSVDWDDPASVAASKERTRGAAKRDSAGGSGAKRDGAGGSGAKRDSGSGAKRDSGSSAAKRESSGGTKRAAAPAAHRDLFDRTRIPSPMLATLGQATDIRDEDEWAFEMKWDGIRALVLADHGRVALVTRNGNDVTAAYPELVEELAAATADRELLLDAEVVALDAKGRPSFGRLQQRMGLSKPREVEAAARRVRVDLMVFDLLEEDGEPLVDEPYDERRRRLEDALPASSGRLHVPPAFDGDLDHALTSSRELGLEGVMAKRRASTYTARRTRDWIKLKHHLAQEVVIGGWRPGNGRRASQVGSLLLGVPDAEGALQYVGRVGTGFTDRQLADIAAKLAPLARKTSPFVDVPRPDARDAQWVTPKLVGEVEFAEWTGDDRLRQPSWRGWRTDKEPSDVVREG